MKHLLPTATTLALLSVVLVSFTIAWRYDRPVHPAFQTLTQIQPNPGDAR